MKTVDWNDNRCLTVIRCPSCGAPTSLESYEKGSCDYCGTAYLIAPRQRSAIEITKDHIACFVDTEMVGEMVSKGLVTMNEGRRAMWPYYARCHGT